MANNDSQANRLARLDSQIDLENNPHKAAKLYYQAAILFSDNDIDQACFFMTQAFIIAIDCANHEIKQLSLNYLKAHDRI